MLNACYFHSHLLECYVLVIKEKLKMNFIVMKLILITWFAQSFVSVRVSSPFLSLDDILVQ